MVPFALASGMIVGCSDSYDDQLARLTKFVKANRIGSSADVWLVKRNAFGQQERIGLIFGMASDIDFCNDIAASMNAKFREAGFSCRMAD